MISKDFVLRLHQLSIHLWGGSDGVRDISSLESGIIRPYQTFGGENLYNDVFGKAAAIIESIIINHPFVDGNKNRIARYVSRFEP